MKTSLLVTILFTLAACGPEVAAYMGPAMLLSDAPNSTAVRSDSQVIYVFPSDDNSTLLVSGIVTELVGKRALGERIEFSPITSSKTRGTDFSETVTVLDGGGSFNTNHADFTLHLQRTTTNGTDRRSENLTATFSGSKI